MIIALQFQSIRVRSRLVKILETIQPIPVVTSQTLILEIIQTIQEVIKLKMNLKMISIPKMARLQMILKMKAATVAVEVHSVGLKMIEL